jgi:hypothetical protein
VQSKERNFRVFALRGCRKNIFKKIKKKSHWAAGCLLGSVPDNNALISAQMSAFAYDIDNWRAPAHVMGDPRFWVRAYQNPDLSEERRYTSTSFHIENLIIDYMQAVEMPK